MTENAAPPGMPQCPECGGIYEHAPRCTLTPLSIPRAARLGLAAALDEIRNGGGHGLNEMGEG